MLQQLRCLPHTGKAKGIIKMKGDIDSDVIQEEAKIPELLYDLQNPIIDL